MSLFSGYISYAPFPEGFEGDMDETFQQSGQLATIFITGNFLSGIYYPNGTTPPPTLPTSDQGPIALNGIWYFWDPASGQYVPQSSTVKPGTNYCKNIIYQVQQLGSTFALTTIGPTKTFDMAVPRVTQPNVLSVSADVGPTATADTDTCQSAIKYTVGPQLVSSIGATDFFSHEHLIEGSDIVMAQGEILSLAFSVMSTQPGTYSGYLASPGRDASYVFNFTIATAGLYTRVKISNIPAFPSNGTWQWGEGQTGLYLGVVMGVGAQYQTATPNQWVSGFFAGTSSNLTSFLSVLNNQLKVSAIKLESNPTPSFCTVKSFEEDFHDAIRYYWTSFNYQSFTGGAFATGIAPAAGEIQFALIFPRRMCATPSVVPYSYLNQKSGYITDQTLNLDISQANLIATPKGIAHHASGGTLIINGNTHTSITIDGMTTVAGLIVGMPVSGSGIPAGATVATIGPGNQITISVASTTSLTNTPLTFSNATLVIIGNTHTNNAVDGMNSTAGVVVGMEVTGPSLSTPGNTYSTTTIDGLSTTVGLIVGMLVTSPSPVINGNVHVSTTIDGLSSTTGLVVGMSVVANGNGIGPGLGAVITGIVSSTSVTISVAGTGAHTNVPITFGSGIPAGATIATIVSGTSVTISNAANSSIAGLPITFGSGIPPNTTVQTIPGNNSVTLSNPTTATLVNVPITFSFPVPQDLLLTYVTADARLS